MFLPMKTTRVLTCHLLAVLLLLVVGARGQVLERLVSLQGAAAGNWISGKLLPASDGNFVDIPETMTQP